MKNKIAIIILCLLAIGAGGGWYVWRQYQDQSSPTIETGEFQKFYLDDELYSGSTLMEISAEEFEQLIQAKSSFIVIAHMDVCPAETPLTSTAESLALADGYTFYGLKADVFRETQLATSVKYLPSAAIYQNGKLVSYLDAESDADIPFYQNADGLRTWLDKYIYLTKE